MLVVTSRHALCNKKVVALCRDHFVKKQKKKLSLFVINLVQTVGEHEDPILAIILANDNKSNKSNNVHENITGFWSAKNECILMSHECKVVKQCKLQIARARFKIWSVLTFFDVFSYTLLTSTYMISLAIWCNKHL